MMMSLLLQARGRLVASMVIFLSMLVSSVHAYGFINSLLQEVSAHQIQDLRAEMSPMMLAQEPVAPRARRGPLGSSSRYRGVTLHRCDGGGGCGAPTGLLRCSALARGAGFHRCS